MPWRTSRLRNLLRRYLVSMNYIKQRFVMATTCPSTSLALWLKYTSLMWFARRYTVHCSKTSSCCHVHALLTRISSSNGPRRSRLPTSCHWVSLKTILLTKSGCWHSYLLIDQIFPSSRKTMLHLLVLLRWLINSTSICQVTFSRAYQQAGRRPRPKDCPCYPRARWRASLSALRTCNRSSKLKVLR